jgi:hypothetical protein
MISHTRLHSFLGLFSLSAALAQTPSLSVSKDSNSNSHFVNLSGNAESDFSNWELKSSTDLITWDDAKLSSLTSGEWAFTTNYDTPSLYFRASFVEDVEDPEPDPDLYDLAAYRVMELTFDQSNWAAQLDAEYGNEVNLSADLSLDGELHPGVGVRYKGDTSYRLATTAKKSFSVYVDETDPDLTLMNFGVWHQSSHTPYFL